MVHILKAWVWVLTLLVCVTASAAESTAVGGQIRQLLKATDAGGNTVVADQALVVAPLLRRFYAARDYRPVWAPERWRELVAVLRASRDDGLSPDDYYVAALQRAGATQTGADLTAADKAELDLLFTEGLIRLVYHLQFGKVDPTSLNADWQPQRVIDDRAPLAVLQQLAASDDIAASIDAHRPRHPIYQRMQEALARYMAIQDSGGWQPVEAGPTLRLGDSGERVRQLRSRLLESGDLQEDTGVISLFDASLENAVRNFQQRHGLTPDGLVGGETLKALNQTVASRVAQIRVNLERARWVLHELEERYVVVDIAGFEVLDVQPDGSVWRTRAQVGRPYRSTPVFRSQIDHLVINPTWTVPPTILSKDLLPARRKDPDYFKARNIRVLDRTGNYVDEQTIDWSRYPEQPFPYMLRQDPGPKNALGRIKFMFPNEHAVYLHDTPSRGLFERDQRAFSSGCIRVELPYQLAERLLDEPAVWGQERIRGAVDSGQTQTLRLKAPVTVILMYWTADATADGRVRFKRDIYQRDQALLQALNAPFRLHARHIKTARSGK